MKSKQIKYVLLGILMIALMIGSFLFGKNSKKIVSIENYLTPSLTTIQFKENINALITQGATTGELQEYMGNYQKDSYGNFVLKNYSDK